MTKARCARCIEYETLIRAMKELLNEMPVKHPQQAERRAALNELVAESERLGFYK